MKCCFVLVLLMLFCFAQAQTTFKSQIISSDGKDAIGYAHIFNKETRINSLSDSTGWFNIQCKKTDTIVVRCMGFKTLTIIAADAIQKKTIELAQDTIFLSDISVTPENAYALLLQAIDSTNRYMMKSFQGNCFRQDKLSFNGNMIKKLDAAIVFNQKRIKHGQAVVDYWLKDLNSESKDRVSDQPRIYISNEIPLDLIKMPKGKAKYTVVLNCDSMIIINAKMAIPTHQLTNENNYFINKKTWIIRGTEFKGEYEIKQLKKGNCYFFQTKAQMAITNYGDSCALKSYAGNFVFSYKKVNPQNLWEYILNMDIISTQNAISMPDDKKLRPLDFLLYKDKKKY